MIIQENVLKHYLKNVYFISGTPCGGKTTVSRALAARYCMPVFDIDAEFDRHRAYSDPAHQPAMNKVFKDADAFFGRSVAEYKNWLLDNTREQLDFVLMDLIRLSQNQKVLCDCHLTLEQARQISEPSRVAFLVKDPANLVEEYADRPDHLGFSDFLYSATDVEQAKKTCNQTLLSLNQGRYDEIKSSEFFWLERGENSTVEQTVAQVATHFGRLPSIWKAGTVQQVD